MRATRVQVAFGLGVLAYTLASSTDAAPRPGTDPTLEMCVNRPTACTYMLIGYYQTMMITHSPLKCVGPNVARDTLVAHLRRHREDWHKDIEEQLNNALCKSAS